MILLCIQTMLKVLEPAVDGGIESGQPALKLAFESGQPVLKLVLESDQPALEPFNSFA